MTTREQAILKILKDTQTEILTLENHLFQMGKDLETCRGALENTQSRVDDIVWHLENGKEF